MIGGTANPWDEGGDVTAHSRVSAPQGLAPVGSPRKWL